MAKEFLLGLDVGGTKIEAALLAPTKETSSSLVATFTQGHEENYKILARERVPTEREKGYQSIIKKISDLSKKITQLNNVDPTDLIGVGLGLPGTINPKTQKMLNGNTAALIGKDIVASLHEETQWDCDFFLENDANCFALAETMCGAGLVHRKKTGQKFSELRGVGIILGTGCGGGLVLNGKIYNGKNGGASEFGHIILIDNGHPCYCGRRGCAEQYLSGPAFEAAFNDRRYTQVKDVYSAKDIFEKAIDKEPVALAVYINYKRHLAKFLGSLTCAIDPDFFVLGGGMSRQEIIYDGLDKMALDRTFLPLDELDIYPSQLGDSSGVIGAAFLPVIQ